MWMYKKNSKLKLKNYFLRKLSIDLIAHVKAGLLHVNAGLLHIVRLNPEINSGQVLFQNSDPETPARNASQRDAGGSSG